MAEQRRARRNDEAEETLDMRMRPANERGDRVLGIAIEAAAQAIEAAESGHGAVRAVRPRVLTVEEAAALLRIGRSAAYAAVRRGEIPSVRLGRSLRVPRARLEEILMNGHDGPNGGP